MELKLKRIALRDTYTIGRLYVDNHYFSDTLEDKVRDYNKDGVVYRCTRNSEVALAHDLSALLGLYVEEAK